MVERPLELTTLRLRLIAATPALLRAEVEGIAQLCAALGVAVPPVWPPEGGEYDRDAAAFFLSMLERGGADAAGWYSWYVLHRPEPGGTGELVASVGYMGPPDPAGSVEIGYSVCAAWRGRGFATEITAALIENAVQRGATQVRAHARADNAASLMVLARNGFRPIEPDSPDLLLLVRDLPGSG